MEGFKLHSRFYYSRLTREDQHLYRQIYDQFYGGGSRAVVTLPGYGRGEPCGLRLHDLVRCVLEDNPHLFHLEPTAITYSRQGTRMTIETAQVYTPEEYTRAYKALLGRAEAIAQTAGTMGTALQKVRYLHDTLARSITYSFGAGDRRSTREVHTIAGALLNGACVCDGYARAMRLLCDMAEISCIVVTGEAAGRDGPGPHAWNILKLGGGVYHVDVTWDSCLSGILGLSHRFFLRGDDAFRQDHTWNRTLYPECPGDWRPGLPD